MAVVANLRVPSPAISLRLLRIEARRSLGLPAFPAMVPLAGVFAADKLSSVPLWMETSVVIRDTALLLGPLLGGLAARAAARERARGAEDLLLSTARPATARRLATMAGTALWGALAYLCVAAVLMGWTYARGAWGAPVLWPLVTGLLTVLACASVGHALGVLAHSRFTAPLAAVGLFLLLFLPLGVNSWHRLLNPMTGLEGSVYHGLVPDLGLKHSLMLLGVTLLALGVPALRDGSRKVGLNALVNGTSAAGFGVAMLVAEHAAPGATRWTTPARIPYTPVCSEAKAPVCVHPAYESLLEELSGEYNRVLAPLAGVPGAPVRAEQREFLDDKETEGVLAFTIPNTVGTSGLSRSAMLDDARWALEGVVRAPLSEPRDPRAQTAIRIWLIYRTHGLDCEGWRPDRAPCEAARRFDALGPARQRAWLERNFADLRSGKIGLEELP